MIRVWSMESRPACRRPATDACRRLESAHMSAAFNRRWAIGDDRDVFCTGWPPLGWFGPA